MDSTDTKTGNGQSGKTKKKKTKQKGRNIESRPQASTQVARETNPHAAAGENKRRQLPQKVLVDDDKFLEREDPINTEVFAQFIQNNKNLFKNKVVLNISCGSGVLAVLAAKAGAKKVWG